IPHGGRAARAVHLVVQPRPGVGQERRLAHRLSDRQRIPGGRGAFGEHLQGQTFLRPRAPDHGLRSLSEAPRAESGRRGWLESTLVYRNPRVLAMLFLGFSAGLPFPLVLTTLSVRLRQAGIDRTTIGFFSLVGLAYSLKYFWAPVIDRLRLP